MLSRIVDEQTIHGLRNVRREWLTEGDELALYNFLTDYLTRYGRLPSSEALQQNGYLLAHPDQPVDYYRDQVSTRYIIGVARDQYLQLNEAVRNYDADAVRAAHRALSLCLSVGNSDIVISDLHTESLNAIERARQAIRNSMLGYTCGYDVFDRENGGHQRGDIDFYVGRPNTGKSYFLLRDAYVNWRNGVPVMLISLEMTNVQMATRTLGMYAGVNPDQFKTGTISTWQRRRLDRLVGGMVNDTPFYFLSGLKRKSVGDIESAIDLVDPAIVYIDAGYLLTTESSKYIRSRREVIAEVIESLKDLAQRTNKAFVLTVQFNRNVQVVKKGKKKEEETNSDMGLEDIGETDVIGQQASNVIGIHPPKRDPVSQMRRILQNIKNREGKVMTKLEVHYKFHPAPNLDAIGVVEDTEQGTDDSEERRSQANVQNMAWMV